MATAVRTIRAVFTLAVLTPCVLLLTLSAASSHVFSVNVPHLFQASPHQAVSRQAFARHHGMQGVSPSNVTGTYDGPHTGTLDVLELPRKRIQFYLIVLEDVPPSKGPDQGEASGIVPLRHGLAVYHIPVDLDNPDRGGGTLTLRFSRGKVRVSQEGDMEFGAGVSASGTYIRHSRKPPKFNKEGESI